MKYNSGVQKCMNNRFKYLFKNLGILTISNFASKILVFLLVPLYTSVLSTTEYGTYDLVITTISMLFPILTVNVVDAVMRFCIDKEISKEDVALIGIKYITISICAVGLILSFMHWLNVFPNLLGLKRYIFLYYLSYVLNQFFIQFAKGLEKVKYMGIAGVLSTIVMLGANVFFLLVLKLGLPGFFIANILAQIVPTLYYFVKLRFWKYIRALQINKDLEKQMFYYCAPLLFTTLGWWVNSAADRYTVTFICGVAANGILSVSYKIPSIINTLQSIFTQAWQISAIKEYGEKDVSEFYGKTFIYLNILMSAVCSGLIILSKPLAHILYAKDFYSAWQYVPFLLISSVLNCASGFIGPILSAKKDSKNMALSSIYGAIINIFLNIGLVYIIGAQGATIATAISSYLIFYFRKKSVKNEFHVKEFWRILLTWMLLVCQAIIEIYISSWLLEGCIMLILMMINRKILKDSIMILLKKKK